MELIIKKQVAEEFGFDFFEPYGVSEDSWGSWRTTYELDLSELSMEKLEQLLAAFQEAPRSIRGVTVLEYDVQNWIQTLKKGVANRRSRTVRQFQAMLTKLLLDVEGHRIYRRHEEGAMLAYYVGEVEYHPPVTATAQRSGHPAYVTMTLYYETIGGVTSDSVSFHSEDCVDTPVAEALGRKGFLPENPELRTAYIATRKLYGETAPQVGKQYWATGRGETLGRSYDRSRISLDHDGEESRVVIDVFKEVDEEEDRERRVNLPTWFWPNVVRASNYDEETDTRKGEDDEDDGYLSDKDKKPLRESEDVSLERPKIEIPVHPWLIVFHLAKHIRVRTHVDQLTPYVYNTEIAEKLILPKDTKNLVQLLIDTKGGTFTDIVPGKGGGAVVLLTGPPGTGKTLTAEVYAESEERALYSVQCSQLGVDPEKLEEELLTVFERAKRWDAVILLDEADVYVHERGSSMSQNAIVGVFLRVLEYQDTVMFLTSNRPEDVDDAIASRCIARLNYAQPNPSDSKKIWRVLADISDIPISAAVIAEVVEKNPGMTGRDIKNVLKLASLMNSDGAGITASQVAYVQQFRPTGVYTS